MATLHVPSSAQPLLSKPHNPTHPVLQYGAPHPMATPHMPAAWPALGYAAPAAYAPAPASAAAPAAGPLQHVAPGQYYQAAWAAQAAPTPPPLPPPPPPAAASEAAAAGAGAAAEQQQPAAADAAADGSAPEQQAAEQPEAAAVEAGAACDAEAAPEPAFPKDHWVRWPASVLPPRAPTAWSLHALLSHALWPCPQLFCPRALPVHAHPPAPHMLHGPPQDPAWALERRCLRELRAREGQITTDVQLLGLLRQRGYCPLPPFLAEPGEGEATAFRRFLANRGHLFEVVHGDELRIAPGERAQSCAPVLGQCPGGDTAVPC